MLLSWPLIVVFLSLKKNSSFREDLTEGEGGRLSTVDLIKATCFVEKVKKIFSI
jgi:hypothetical protein